MAASALGGSSGTSAAVEFDPIRHVVVLMLENRSYDEVLGALTAVIPDADGVPAGSHRSNQDPQGVAYFQLPTRSNRVDPGPKHEHPDVMGQIGNHNTGFVRNYAEAFPEVNSSQRAQIMGYFPRGFLRSAHALGETFAICDRWFSSVPGPTWTNRFFVHSATSIGRVKMPEGIFKPNLHFYNQDTIYDRLNERGVSWRIYYGDFPLSLLLTHQLRYVNLRRYRGLQNFVKDAASGDFPQYVFIEPNYIRNPNDDHAPHDSQAAQGLIARVYGALRGNLVLWNQVLLVILYDEHGGFYDHVESPEAVPPDDHREEYTFDRLGVRVPAIFVSPWLGAQVIHEVFDHTSLLKYLADKWRLRSLGRRMEAAANPWRHLTKTAAPRSDTPMSLQVFSRSLPPSMSTEWGLSNLQSAILAYSAYLEMQLPPQFRLHSDELTVRTVEAATIVTDRLAQFMNYRLGAATAAPIP